MRLRTGALLGALIASAPLAPAAAQGLSDGPPPAGWHDFDPAPGAPYGVSTDGAYRFLDSLGLAPRPVVVAVIDGGVDLAHPDLEGQLWTNAGETPGNGADDDGNGYVDDVHGWNFIGGADGRNVTYDSYELAREVARLRASGHHPDALAAREAELAERRAEMEGVLPLLQGAQQATREAHAVLARHFGRADFTMDEVAAIGALAKAEVQQARELYGFLAANGLNPAALDEQVDQVEGMLAYGLNPDFDPRDLVGDDPADLDERGYGNPDVTGPRPSHGTGVAGLIAAVRGNGTGIDGVAGRPGVARVMGLRAVPQGDERDKDVANAIRYAVDNGARIVNMSFGKGLSPDKAAVDAAVRYAAERGVLLVHAAGNDGADIDAGDNYPTAVLDDGTWAPTWIEVGASAAEAAALAASFSNYGATRVNVFAPGAQVTSLAPGGGTTVADGTSFAAPVVSGVAALVMAYFPDLSAEAVRAIVLESAVPYVDLEVPGPGSGATVRFGALSTTGGLVNAERAVRLAHARAAL